VIDIQIENYVLFALWHTQGTLKIKMSIILAD